MASEIRVDKITSLSGVGTISPSPTGVEIAGITTVSTLKVGSGTTIFPSGGLFTTNNITIDRGAGDGSSLRLISSDNDPDYKLAVTDGKLEIQDITNSFAKRFVVDTDGSINVGSGITLSPEGNIFATGISTIGNSMVVESSSGGERLRINSAGLVGIGTDNPLAVLHVEKSGTSQVLARFESNMGTNDNRSLSLTSPTSDSASLPFTFSTGNSIQFKIDAHIVHIDDDGRLGIGTDSSIDEDLVIHDVSPSLKLTSTSTVGNTNIYFGDMDSSTQGRIQYHNNGDFFRFFTNGNNERFRITSDGSALFNGLTSQVSDTSKLAIQGGSSNIGIIQIHAGGGENGGDLSGIAFSHGASNQTARAKCAIASRAIGSYGKGHLCFYVDGTDDDNQVSSTDEKLRILNTGGITFNGDTSTDNALDDYEEGNWSPKQTDGGTNFTTSFARYTKIGRIVHISFDITRNTTGNTTQIWNLPFLPSAYSSWTLAYYAISGSTTNTGTSGYVAGRHGGLVVHTGGGYLHTRIQGGTVAWNITPDDRLIGSATYETAT